MRQSHKILILFVGLLILSGCNKEKAEAIKVAAEKFKNDAISALDKMSFLFTQNISVVKLSEEQEIETIINDLNQFENINDINASVLDHWTKEAELGKIAESAISSEFDNLKLQYYRFESIFNSLDKGSFFAKDAVKEAEKHAIKLTLQLINFSKILQENDFRFSARRVLIIERMKEAKSEENEDLQQELLKRVAREFVQLRIEENQYKDEAIRECLKSAESGRIVAELIKDYDKMKVSDILNSIKNSMNYASQITDGNKKIGDLLTKFEGIETTIKEDPYWKIVLDQQIDLTEQNEIGK